MYGVCVCDFMRAWDPIQSRLGVCMQWGAHAQVGRFATGGDVSGLLGWGLFWAFFFFFLPGDLLHSNLVQSAKRGNRKRQSRSKAAQGLVERTGANDWVKTRARRRERVSERVSETRAWLERLESRGQRMTGLVHCKSNWGTVEAEITAEKGSKPSE